MPARPPPLWTCYCTSCLDAGGVNADGLPRGRTFPDSQRGSHLARVQAEATARHAAEQRAQEEAQRKLVDDVAATIVVSTLADSMPSDESQPSRLWSSRTEFQNSLPRPDPVAAEHAIISVVDRLASIDLSSANVSDPPTGKLPPIKSTQPTLRTQEPHASQYSSLSKRENNKMTKVTHRALDVVEDCVESALEKLTALEKGTSQGIPAPWSLERIIQSLSSIETTLAKAQSVFDSVKRCTPSIDKRRNPIRFRLTRLHERFLILRSAYPVTRVGPLEYNSGWFLFHDLQCFSLIYTSL